MAQQFKTRDGQAVSLACGPVVNAEGARVAVLQIEQMSTRFSARAFLTVDELTRLIGWLTGARDVLAIVRDSAAKAVR